MWSGVSVIGWECCVVGECRGPWCVSVMSVRATKHQPALIPRSPTLSSYIPSVFITLDFPITPSKICPPRITHPHHNAPHITTKHSTCTEYTPPRPNLPDLTYSHQRTSPHLTYLPSTSPLSDSPDSTVSYLYILG